ncbi:hypothetical protein [Demetria terragena]|uniref:hypothetical protein n=1 Tax=Demetria terragena TaxID=63959 RepID=UPI000364E73F|nr:hypothetical protein [Demetria terragena]
MAVKAIGAAVAGLLVLGGPASVTPDERAHVVEAVQRADAEIVIRAVRRDDDGTYHALGSKSAEPVLAYVNREFTAVGLDRGASA